MERLIVPFNVVVQAMNFPLSQFATPNKTFFIVDTNNGAFVLWERSPSPRFLNIVYPKMASKQGAFAFPYDTVRKLYQQILGQHPHLNTLELAKIHQNNALAIDFIGANKAEVLYCQDDCQADIQIEVQTNPDFYTSFSTVLQMVRQDVTQEVSDFALQETEETALNTIGTVLTGAPNSAKLFKANTTPVSHLLCFDGIATQMACGMLMDNTSMVNLYSEVSDYQVPAVKKAVNLNSDSQAFEVPPKKALYPTLPPKAILSPQQEKPDVLYRKTKKSAVLFVADADNNLKEK